MLNLEAAEYSSEDLRTIIKDVGVNNTNNPMLYKWIDVYKGKILVFTIPKTHPIYMFVEKSREAAGIR